MPLVHAIDRGDDRWTIWMEDVADVTPWNLDRYHRTAASLGRLAARWPDRTATTTLGIGNRDIAPMFFGKIAHVDLVLQRDDKFWQQPSVATVVDANHRCDLFRLAELMPALLGRLAEVPTALCHGDATPDNFREPAAGGPIVALDWSYGSVGPVGSDLGQLLAGRFESGAARLEDVPAIARTVADGFSEGRVDVRPELVELAWATYLAIRSVFSALVIDHRFDLDETGRHELLVGRAAVARFGLDLALRHATS